LKISYGGNIEKVEYPFEFEEVCAGYSVEPDPEPSDSYRFTGLEIPDLGRWSDSILRTTETTNMILENTDVYFQGLNMYQGSGSYPDKSAPGMFKVTIKGECSVVNPFDDIGKFLMIKPKKTLGGYIGFRAVDKAMKWDEQGDGIFQRRYEDWPLNGYLNSLIADGDGGIYYIYPSILRKINGQGDVDYTLFAEFPNTFSTPELEEFYYNTVVDTAPSIVPLENSFIVSTLYFTFKMDKFNIDCAECNINGKKGYLYNGDCIEDKDKDGMIFIGVDEWDGSDPETKCLGDCVDEVPKGVCKLGEHVVCCHEKDNSGSFIWSVEQDFNCLEEANEGMCEELNDFSNVCRNPIFQDCSFCISPKTEKRVCGVDAKCEGSWTKMGNDNGQSPYFLYVPSIWNGLENGITRCGEDEQCVIYGDGKVSMEVSGMFEGNTIFEKESFQFIPGGISHRYRDNQLFDNSKFIDTKDAEAFYKKWQSISFFDPSPSKLELFKKENPGWTFITSGDSDEFVKAFKLISREDYLPDTENLIINSRYGELDFSGIAGNTDFMNILKDTDSGWKWETVCVEKDKCLDGADNNGKENLFDVYYIKPHIQKSNLEMLYFSTDCFHLASLNLIFEYDV
jgi:hypothetical protein